LLQNLIADTIPLALLVMFFGIQQRGRRQVYYRFWFVGWICVLLSYVFYGAESQGILLHGLVEVVRLDLLLLASLLFMTSFLSGFSNLRRVVLTGLPSGLLVVLMMNLQQMHCAVPRAAMVVAVLAWEGYGLYAAKMLLTGERRLRGRLIVGICVVFAVAMSVAVWRTAAPDLSQWAQAEIFLGAAILYGVAHRRNTPAGVLATAGFTMWAMIYAWSIDAEYLHLSAQPSLLHLYWMLPKYLIAFAMILKIFEDAQDEKTAMAEQNRSMYEDLRMVFDYNPHPALIYAGQTGELLLVNRAAMESYGYSEEEFLARRLADLEVEADEESKGIDAKLPPVSDGVRARFRHRDGHKMWVVITGHPVRYMDVPAQLVIVRDLDKTVQMELEMVQRAHHDALTGLPNRLLLADRMQLALERSVREEKKLAVYAIDIDHFKVVNDTYGHLAGDACLKAVATRLNSKIRSIDTLARLGGEEFLAVVGGLSKLADAERIARDLLQLFETPLQLPEFEVAMTVSIGVAIFPEDGHNAETLYKRADEALYEAKRNGRNRYVVGRLQAEQTAPTPSLQGESPFSSLV
jgi:diguanylate cyclase (GGDEF)-like protein/PAS domain S-box-containing protein